MIRKAICTLLLLGVASLPAFADDWKKDSRKGKDYKRYEHRDRYDYRHRDSHSHIRISPGVGINFHFGPSGRWEYVTRKEWVPGYYERVWVPEKREEIHHRAYTDRYGRYHRAWTEVRIVRPAGYEKVWREGYYKTYTERVWVRC